MGVLQLKRNGPRSCCIRLRMASWGSAGAALASGLAAGFAAGAALAGGAGG